MTDFQKAEFLKYGCLSKAIIKACDSQISVGDFCAKYGEWFRPEFYGMPIADKIPLIIQDFGFRISADEWDFYSVRASLFDGKPVITFSHVMLKDGDGAEFNHATVLHSIADDSFQVWSYFHMIIILFDREIDSDIYTSITTEQIFHPSRSAKLTLKSADEKLMLVFDANGEPGIQQILDAKEKLLSQLGKSKKS